MNSEIVTIPVHVVAYRVRAKIGLRLSSRGNAENSLNLMANLEKPQNQIVTFLGQLVAPEGSGLDKVTILEHRNCTFLVQNRPFAVSGVTILIAKICGILRNKGYLCGWVTIPKVKNERKCAEEAPSEDGLRFQGSRGVQNEPNDMGKVQNYRLRFLEGLNVLKCPNFATSAEGLRFSKLKFTRNYEKKGILQTVVTIIELEIASNQAFLPRVNEKQGKPQVTIQKMRNLLKTPEEKNSVYFTRESLPRGARWSLLSQRGHDTGYDSLRRQGRDPCD